MQSGTHDSTHRLLRLVTGCIGRRPRYLSLS